MGNVHVLEPISGGKVLSWKPLTPEHAIERVRFEIQFAEPLPKKVVEQIGIKHDAKAIESRFGERHEQRIAKFTMGPGGPAVAESNGNEIGWLSTRVSGVENAAVEALGLQNSLLSYESSDYRGWTKSFKRFQSVCGDLLVEAGNLVNASSATLEYFDRFIFDGPVSDARPDGLLSDAVLAMLPESARSGRELWHVHSGWYEMLGEDRCLINQNFDAQQGNVAFNKEARSVQIYSKCEIKKDRQGFNTSEIEHKFELLHRRSIELICSTITATMANDIGITRES